MIDLSHLIYKNNKDKYIYDEKFLNWLKKHSFEYYSLRELCLDINISYDVISRINKKENLELKFNKTLQRKLSIERPMKYHVGDKIGNLTVIEKIYTKGHGDKSKFLMRCDCGNEFLVLPYTLNSRKEMMCKECAIKKYIGTGKWLPKRGRNNNTYNIKEDVVIINDQIIIDLDDLERVKSLGKTFHINCGGYAICDWKGEDLFLHRFILGLPIKYDSNTCEVGDHINRNRLDCRKSNLRILTKSENSINCSSYKTNTSGHAGISFIKRLNKWQANITINGETIYLGVYTDKEDAIRVREEAEEKYYGELNRK